MTRERAAELLSDVTVLDDPEMVEAHRVAISALRQQETVTNRNEPPTNAQKIRAMSDEELALWICGVYDIEEEHGKFINGIIIPGYAPHDIEEWLQQPAEEG